MSRSLASIFGLPWMLSCALLAGCSVSPQSPGDSAIREPEVEGRQEVSSGGSAQRGPSAKAPEESDLLTAELNTVGWDQLSGSPVVLLRELDSGQMLPIWIGVAEARAISFELHGIEVSRPMTHDLMTNVLTTLGARLEEVVVSDLRQGTYYGLLKLRVEGDAEPRWVDTRPSDGLALALRSDAKIRIAKKLIDNLPEFDFMAPETPEQVVRALGLTVVMPSEELRSELSLPDRPGLAVIATSGQAKKAGLARGDLIVAIEGETPREPIDLLRAIEDATGRRLEITYLRDGSETSVELSLDLPERPKSKNIA